MVPPPKPPFPACSNDFKYFEQQIQQQQTYQQSLKDIMGIDAQYIPYGGFQGLRKLAAQCIRDKKLEDNFYICDLGRLLKLYQTWKFALPRVKPFYAVKCNPDKQFVKALCLLGSGFDCASASEMDVALESGVDPANIIFANCQKRPRDIRHARSAGVKLQTFDTFSELTKIQALYPDSELVLRIRADDPDSQCNLGVKYGCDAQKEAPQLLEFSKNLGLNVVGVSFHVGSGCQNYQAYSLAIQQAAHVFDVAKGLGIEMSLLDIGGGFFGRFDSKGEVIINEVSDAINSALELYFPSDNVQVIAEPGRYFAECTFSLGCQVIGSRDRQMDSQGNSPVQSPRFLDLTKDSSQEDKLNTREELLQRQPQYTQKEAHSLIKDYWITDGLYGSMNGIIYDHCEVQAGYLKNPSLYDSQSNAQFHMFTKDEDMIKYKNYDPKVKYQSTVFGPTCDGLDVVFKGVQLPNLEMGDWLLFQNFGAYTLAGATDFNGIEVSDTEKVYCFSETVNDGLQGPDNYCLIKSKLSDLDIL